MSHKIIEADDEAALDKAIAGFLEEKIKEWKGYLKYIIKKPSG